MRSLLFGVAAAVIAWSCAGAAWAEGNTGLVYIRVIDAKSGKPQKGWTVQVTGREGDITAITGAGGQASFISVPVGMVRIDVLQNGELGACPAVIEVSASESTIVNVHVTHAHTKTIGCSPRHATTTVRPGVTADVYDIY
jgi:hypothetical protein